MTDDESPKAPAGWYPTPEGGQRYWNGSAWTDLPAPSSPATSSPEAQLPRPHRRKSSTVIAIVVTVVVVLGGIGAAIAMKLSSDAQASAAASAEAAAKAQQRQEDREKAAEAAKKKADEAERAARAEQIEDIEASVEKMAKEHVDEDFIDGPVLDVGCVPVDGGSADDLTETTTVFQCFVSTEKHKDGSMSGYYYNATMNWTTGSYTYGYGQP